jgi:hypothetical protein
LRFTVYRVPHELDDGADGVTLMCEAGNMIVARLQHQFTHGTTLAT